MIFNNESKEPKKVKSMEVYEELQNPDLRLVLSSIPQFQEETNQDDEQVV